MVLDRVGGDDLEVIEALLWRSPRDLQLRRRAVGCATALGYATACLRSAYLGIPVAGYKGLIRAAKACFHIATQLSQTCYGHHGYKQKPS